MSSATRTRHLWATPPAPALGLRVDRIHGAWRPDQLVSIARRRNPKRAQLLVSPVLARHIPTPAAVARRATRDLAASAGDAIGRLGGSTRVGVVGFAETATALAIDVGRALGAEVAGHSTRSAHAAWAIRFTEAHSHAPGHGLTETLVERLAPLDTIVVVDDELSTGQTALEMIRALATATSARRWVVASLVDARGRTRGEELDNALRAEVADSRVEQVSLLHATIVSVPGEETGPPTPPPVAVDADPARDHGQRHQLDQGTEVRRVSLDDGDALGWSANGWVQIDHHRLDLAAERLALELARSDLVTSAASVIAVEEQVAPALAVAHALGRNGIATTVQSTSRSPVVVADVAGYPIRTSIALPSPITPGVETFLHNPPPTGQPVVVVTTGAFPPDLTGLRDALGAYRGNGSAIAHAHLPARAQP